MCPGRADSISLLFALSLGFPLFSGLSPLYCEPPALCLVLVCRIAGICSTCEILNYLT